MDEILDSRTIRVFISSTFGDMQDERDELVSKVFPMLRQRCEARGVSLIDVDLRWGITAEESRGSKVVEICLDEIQRSHPFFIGILGNRYGWIPRDENVDWSQVLPSRYGWAADDIRDGLSMTEIEIQYGVLRNDKQIHCSFYLKEGKQSDSRQARLRQLVEDQERYPVRHYLSVQELAEQVEDDFISMLDELFPEEEFGTSDYIKRHRKAIMQGMVRHYVLREMEEHLLNSFAQETETEGMLVTGFSGIGKSALLAYWCIQNMEKDEFDVVAVLAGVDGICTMAEALCDICRQLSDLYGLAYDRDALVVDELRRMASELEQQKKLLIIIDGIDQLEPSQDTPESLVWWPNWKKGVKVVFSCDTDCTISRNVPERWEKMTVRPLSIDQKKSLADMYFKEYRKRLTTKQTELLMSGQIKNTLAYVTLLDEIRRFGQFENLDEHLKLLVGCEDAEQFFVMQLHRQDTLFGGGETAYRKILRLLAVSEDGLPETVLPELAGLSRMAVSEVIGMCGHLLTAVDGHLKISNTVFKKVVWAEYLSESNSEMYVRNLIIDYYEHYFNDAIACFELAYQNNAANHLDDLYILLCRKEILERFYDAHRLSQLAAYWHRLIYINPYRYDIQLCLGELNDYELNLGNGLFDMMFSDFMSSITGGGRMERMVDMASALLLRINNPESVQRVMFGVLCMTEEDSDDSYCELRQKVRNALAVSYMRQNRWDDARKEYLDILESGEVDESDAVVLNLGELYLQCFEYSHNRAMLDNALLVLRTCLEARIAKYGRLHSDVAVAYADYASAMAYIDQEESLRMQNESLNIYRLLAGENNVDVAIQYHNIAAQLMYSDPEKALIYARKSLSIYKGLPNTDVHDIVDAYELLATALINDESYTQAAECLSYAEKLAEQHSDHNALFSLREKFVNAAGMCECFDLALEVADRMMASAENQEEELKVCSLRGGVMRRANRLKDAAKEYAEAIHLSIETGNTSKEIENRILLATVLWSDGKMDDALMELESVIALCQNNDYTHSKEYTFALFNSAQIIFSQKGDANVVVSRIEEAIAIRKEIADEDDSDLATYISQLEKMKQVYAEDSSTDSESYNMSDAEEMDGYIGPDNSAAVEFREGLSLLCQGLVDPALSSFRQAKELLQSTEHNSAKAMAARYTALAQMIMKCHGKRADLSADMLKEEFGSAVELALMDENHHLAAQIFKDYGDFFNINEEYKNAELLYWSAITEEHYVGEFYSHSMLSLLTKVASAISCQNNKDRIELAIWNIAYMISNHIDADETCHIADKVLELMRRCNVEDNSIFFDKEALTLARYLLGEKIYDVAYFYAMNAENYEREDNVFVRGMALVIMIRIETCRGCYSSALELAQEFAERYLPNAIGASRSFYGRAYAQLYAQLHDEECFNKVSEDYGLDENEKSQYMSEVLPCTMAQLSGQTSVANRMYDETINDELSESGCYDLACFCILTRRPLEAQQFYDKWRTMVSDDSGQVKSCFRVADQILSNRIAEFKQ